MFVLLASAYLSASEPCQTRLLDQALHDPQVEDAQDIEVDIRQYEIYNLLVWLHQVAPDSDVTTQQYEEFQQAHKGELEPREHPDLDSYVTRLAPTRSPVTVDELLDKDPEKLIDELLTYQGTAGPWTRSGGKVVFGEPKTKKSRRSIRLTPQAVEALRSHLERQLEDMEILGDHYQDQDLVFATDTGGPINPSNLRQRSFAQLLLRAGLPHMRFHDLRHTCATLLLSRGVHPKFVQELLGHATIAITLDTYSHVMPSMGDATAKAMAEALA